MHCSTTAVYQPDGHGEFTRTHRSATTTATTTCRRTRSARSPPRQQRATARSATTCRRRSPGSTSRTATAAAGRCSTSRRWRPGKTIAVHADAPSVFQPIHSDDIVATVPKLLEIAGIPPTTVNWGGDEKVSVEDWTAYLGELTGLTPKLAASEHSLASVRAQPRPDARAGRARDRSHWKDGMRRMVESMRPDLLKA